MTKTKAQDMLPAIISIAAERGWRWEDGSPVRDNEETITAIEMDAPQVLGFVAESLERLNPELPGQAAYQIADWMRDAGIFQEVGA